MTYQSLYRKYRPKHLDEVVGQEHILNVLNNALKKDMISHAYLFCGPRGTGKTSIAKLMAQAINCEKSGEVACKTCANCLEGRENTHPDIVEIDAASNNGVEEIRSIIEKVKYTPILGKYKVYIIDEVHMLSQGAFNAFLKTLEEPPEHAVFILATTEIHKVLPTIISRCQRFDFTNIKDADITKRLQFILEKENAKAEAGVCELIASLSNGALRNALTILEQAIIIADDEIKLSEIYDTNGVVTAEQKIELFSSLSDPSMMELNRHIQKLNENVISVERLMMDLVRGIKDSVVFAYTKNDSIVTYFDLPFIKYLNTAFTVDMRMAMVSTLLEYIDKMKFSQNQSTYMELALIALYNSIPKGLDNVSRETLLENGTNNNTFKSENLVNKQEKQITDTSEIKENLLHSTANLDLSEERVQDRISSFSNDEEEQTEADLTTLGEGIEDTIDLEKVENDSGKVIQLPEEAEPEEIVPRETIEVETARELTHIDLVQFMVSADKEARLIDIESFKNVGRYRTDLQWARPSRLLDGATLVLSGEQFVVLAFNSEFEALELMEPRNQTESLGFSELLYGKRKHVYATTNNDFTDAVQLFRTLNDQGKLPEALTAEDFKENETQIETNVVDESLTKVKELFGDQVIISVKE